MDGLNHPIHDYLDQLPGILAKPFEDVVSDLRTSGLAANPVDPEKPLK